MSDDTDVKRMVSSQKQIPQAVDPALLTAARHELARRCKDAGLELKEYEGGNVYIEIQIPAGRNTRCVSLYSYDDIRRFLALPFERYIFLADYYAICSYEDAFIEAALRSLAPPYGWQLVIRRLFPRRGTAENETPNDDIEPIVLSPNSTNGITITLAPASETLKAFYRNEIGGNPHLSLQLSNLRVTQHDQAVSILETLSNSLFFQIDLLTNIPLALTRERNRFRTDRRYLTDNLQYPRTEYDKAPAALYWYAKSAVEMPLLQFLAFYQVLEFYFPVYYQAEAHRKIRGILKDPTFRSDRDSDLSRILGAIQVSRSGNLSDERSQLRATITECVDPDLLRKFLEDNSARKAFLSSKTRGLTDYKLSIANDRADLRSDVADRIYDIRCKIVHTKGDVRDKDVELLLPFSKEADQLWHDIALIEFIAKQVLIAASSPLTW